MKVKQIKKLVGQEVMSRQATVVVEKHATGRSSLPD